MENWCREGCTSTVFRGLNSWNEVWAYTKRFRIEGLGGVLHHDSSIWLIGNVSQTCSGN